MPQEDPAWSSPDIRVGELSDDLRVFDHGFVRLDEAMADDLSVVNGARVSFAVRKEEMEERDRGLIRFLMRERHGCYDEATDVLTDEGWKRWPDVIGEERFATRSPGGRLVYQSPTKLIRKEYRGPMIGFEGMGIDMRVTPDHRVFAAPTTTLSGRSNPLFALVPARDVLWRSHRHLTTARWSGPTFDAFTFDGISIPASAWLRLVGFFIGDGHLAASNAITFHLRKDREITFLRSIVSETSMELRMHGESFAVPVTSAMRQMFADCYNDDRDKIIPRRLLQAHPSLLYALFEGLIESDGSRSVREGKRDRVSYYTTSKELADGVQELALKLGKSASVRPHHVRPGDGHYGSKARWRVSIYNPRNSRPALCRTRAEADNHMGVEEYNGTIHCATVPNGTLYVRRNGYAAWSGNSPFEHNSFRFHIRCPIFVAREWFRHRIGSFNEESSRYHKLSDDFFVPSTTAVRTQVGKPGAYSFEPAEEQIAHETIETFERVYKHLYAEYIELLDKGVAKELARALLPFGIYTQFYWTVNARSLMNFLSLRNSTNAQYEIRTYAQAIERFFSDRMPVTYGCFLEFERKGP